MLKLVYTEADLQLERLPQSIEAFVAKRTVLALRLGQPIHVVPNRAAFLLPTDLPEVLQLAEALTHPDSGPGVELCPVDADYAEVSLQGIWIATDIQAEEGTFLTVLGDRAEGCIQHLWQVAQAQMSFLR